MICFALFVDELFLLLLMNFSLVIFLEIEQA